ncbi:cation-binding protein [Dietzia sp. UCD-THP]|uniref:hemerythrin domain-containing protein n=1 Tax=Dietzia sp. UCD-THP TaxID=1292020 RepID=UPI000365AF0B|nr:hemerythrin domain-containing protein [Dietzia sp. UCD-THP]EYT62343.1 cation-binding protein [Dietzia sp. UCD-THP]
MTSIADQTTTQLGGRLSVLSRQKLDHVKLDRLLRQLDHADAREERQVLLRVYRLVFPHAFAEEAVLWPVLRRVLPDGHQLTLEVEHEHQEVNELVVRLENLPADDPARPGVLARFVEVLRDDVRDEEDQLLPRLQERLGHGRLTALGLAWEVVRRTAPTRAHPVVARRPPGNVAAALPLTVIDRVRDALDTAALRRPALSASPLHRASARLGALAHAIEHLPLLRRGEDPTTRTENR